MTVTEIAVSVIALAIGYGGVSLFLSDAGKPKSAKPEKNSESSSNQPTAHALTANSGEESAAWHEILGVAPDAPAAEIDAAYERLSRQYAPDPQVSLGAEYERRAAKMLMAIRRAYRTVRESRGGQPV